MSYKDLKSFQQAAVIYDFTVEFCDRYVDKSDPGSTSAGADDYGAGRSYRSDRMVGQMEQAARSGKQNIAEGCAVSKTSPKNEMFLLNVARGSLKELLEDYEDFLRQRGLAQWQKEDARAQEVRRLAYRPDPGSTTARAVDYGASRSNMSYRSYMDDPERAANAMIALINQTTYLLNQQMKAVGEQMEERGIARESHDQKLRRVMSEEKRRNEEFDLYLKGIVEKGKKGFIKGKALWWGGVAIVLVLATGLVLYTSDRSDTSDKAHRSDTPTFSSSVSPIIFLGISVAEAQALPQGIKLIESNIEITGPQGERINESVDLNLKAQDNGEYGLVVNPKNQQSFTPGKYTVSADIQTKSGIRHITQDFLWGVLAINPNKSVYRPGETANLALAVLDERGMMVCDAEVRLDIQAPDKSYKTYRSDTSDKTNTIRVNDECHQKKKTQRPDYETEYTTNDPGIYQMTLTATTKNGTYTIEDYFEVRALRQAQGDNSVMVSSSNHFDIERITATRIYPIHEYPVTIKVTPEQDFKGMVTETVPEHFGVRENRSDGPDTTNKTYTTYKTYRSDRSDKLIEWSVDWKAGETYELSYIYKSPEISPQFYLLGSLRLYRSDPADGGASTTDKTYTTYMEPRQWQIAVDAIAFVQSEQGVVNPGTSLDVIFPSNNTSGNLIVVSAKWGSVTATASISDSKGNTYATALGPTTSTGRTQTWYAMNIAAGANTVTVSITSSASLVVFIHEYSGIATTGALDQASSNTGTSASCDTSSVTTTQADELLFAMCTANTNPGTIAADSPFTEREQYNTRNASSDRIVSSTGSYSGTFTLGGSVGWVTHIVTFKAASAANSPTITSVSDTPDPTNPGRSVTFITDWNDADSGETVKVKACKTDALSAQNCTGGFWASSSAFTTTDPESLVYDIVGGDAGQTRSYYAFVCDDDGNCSSSTSGTFVVNQFSTVPNIKTRGASGSGPGTVNIR